jgi:TRAP-type mannitol/chloroaromatic compound transport system permease small subunit
MWIIEMAQFTITAYYLLGGGYSMLTDDHVRMDLFYGKLSKKGKAKMDIFTSFFLIFYLAILFFGSITSLIYTIETKQKLFTAWAPYVWPIKTLMLIGILLMLLQAFSSLFKNIANVKNKKYNYVSTIFKLRIYCSFHVHNNACYDVYRTKSFWCYWICCCSFSIIGLG